MRIDKQIIFDLVNDGKPISLFSPKVRLALIALGFARKTEPDDPSRPPEIIFALTEKGKEFFSH